MEEDFTPGQLNKKEERPQFLKVLCILSFISLGFTFLGNISQFVNGPASKEEMQEQKIQMTKVISQMQEMNLSYWEETIRKLIAMTESLNNHFYGVATVTLIAAVIGFYGVLKMWQGQKLGFHFYIIYSLIGVGQMYLFASPTIIPTIILMWNIFISGLFVFLYSRNLNWLK